MFLEVLPKFSLSKKRARSALEILVLGGKLHITLQLCEITPQFPQTDSQYSLERGKFALRRGAGKVYLTFLFLVAFSMVLPQLLIHFVVFQTWVYLENTGFEICRDKNSWKQGYSRRKATCRI